MIRRYACHYVVYKYKCTISALVEESFQIFERISVHFRHNALFIAIEWSPSANESGNGLSVRSVSVIGSANFGLPMPLPFSFSLTMAYK